MTLVADWNFPTEIRIGPGRLAELADDCVWKGIRHPLVVTDQGMAKSDAVRRAMKLLEEGGMQPDLYSDIHSNPGSKDIEAALRHFRNGGYSGIVAVGGGSAIDASKVIAFMAVQRRALWEFEATGDNWVKAEEDDLPPVIAVPTTAGTGAEAARIAFIVDEDQSRKRVIAHPLMMPSVAICDPELLTDMREGLTAATGLDAFAHCLEAYCSTTFHPMADGIALEGMRLIKTWLPIAFRQPENLEARTNTMAAALMGSAAYQKGLGAVHALSHAIGAANRAHHGLCNAVLMRHVLAHNSTALTDKLDLLSRVLDLPEKGEQGVLRWLDAFTDDLGIPKDLSSLAVTEDSIAKIAAIAAQDSNLKTNPVPVGQSELEDLLRRAVRGHNGA